MKHVPVDLIPVLNAGSASQKPKQIELAISKKTDTIETIYTYDKREKFEKLNQQILDQFETYAETSISGLGTRRFRQFSKWRKILAYQSG